MGLRVPLELWWEFSFLLKLGGYTWFLLCCDGASSHDVLGRLASLGMCRLASLLLQCVGDYSLVLAWDFSLDMVGVNSVVMVSSILSSCGLLAPV